ncbi:MAG: hypothetical protein EDM71_04225 [Proteobacteria bacterium]|nr:MAG: hypothetical protein EDM71_04225 [Pseudomonadota bacterium]MBC6945450.1 hypothetical protein [Gammaproteobacteria bacterium]MCE7895745.1 hypothetical protein [Gammaproteobacteria bacterium PRO8]
MPTVHSVTKPGTTLLLIASTAWMATGCIPSRFSGYEPSGQGTREAGYCVAGIKDNFRVGATHGVQVHWWASRDEQAGSILLDVNIDVPDAVTVQLGSPGLVLSSEHWSKPQPLPVAAITAPGPRELDPEAVLIGSSESSRGSYQLWYFPITRGVMSQTGIPAVPTFSAQLPPLLINGETWESAPVTFREYRRWGVYTCVQ